MNLIDDIIIPFLPMLIALGIVLWLLFSGIRDDPISKMAKANFKMKLDKKTGMFWAKAKSGVDVPEICPDCVFKDVCIGNETRPGFVLVDCRHFIPFTKDNEESLKRIIAEED